MSSGQGRIDEPCIGTCTWLLDHEKYRSWMKHDRGLLWIKGAPGTGKSTLMKYATESGKSRLPRPAYAVASFFFSDSGSILQRDAMGLLRSLLHQILPQIPPLLAEFRSMFQRNLQTKGRGGKDWKKEELEDFFRSHIAKKGYRVRIFIDALDECGEDTAEQLVKYFENLTTYAESALSICFSCRHFPSIGPNSTVETICVEDENDKDILTYIQANLQPAFENQEKKVQEIETKIWNRASGIFQWVELVVVETLKLQKRGKPKAQMVRMLLDTPKELDKLYRNILENMDEDERPKALQLMQWVCLAARPLSLKELRFAMAADWPDPSHRPHKSHRQLEESEEYEDDAQMGHLVTSLSGGLVKVKSEGAEHKVQLIHQSVKEFLIKDGLKMLNPSSSNPIGQGHYHLSRACLNYATLEDVHHREGMVQADQFPLLKYAVVSWVWHAERAESECFDQDDLLTCFQWPHHSIFQRWVNMYGVIDPWSEECPDEQATLVHIASSHGLLSVVKSLILKGVDIESKDTVKRTPLSHAAEKGHEKVVQVLLESGAEASCRDLNGWTALSYAMMYGHAGVAKLLMGHGVDTTVNHLNREKYIWNASWRGFKDVVNLLLEKGVEVDTKDSYRRTPLWYSAGKGHLGVVELLLERAAKADSKDIDGRTPLSLAADNGHEAVVNLLLGDKSVEVNSRDTCGRTPLWYAAENGHDAVVQLLLKNDADPNSRDNFGRTSLSWAAENGHEWVVSLLLLNHANFSSPDNEGRTPLWRAEGSGQKRVAELLKNAQPS
jgi:ankyrin repeat protein